MTRHSLNAQLHAATALHKPDGTSRPRHMHVHVYAFTVRTPVTETREEFYNLLSIFTWLCRVAAAPLDTLFLNARPTEPST